MKNKSVIAVIVALIIVVGIVGAIALRGGNSSQQSSTNSSSSSMGDMGMDGQSSGDSGSAASAVATDTVNIENYAFHPQVIKIKVGQKVTWTNTDSVRHSVVSDEGDELNGPLLAEGESYSHTFTKAGTYHYHCQPHPYMKATVVVEE